MKTHGVGRPEKNLSRRLSQEVIALGSLCKEPHLHENETGYEMDQWLRSKPNIVPAEKDRLASSYG